MKGEAKARIRVESYLHTAEAVPHQCTGVKLGQIASQRKYRDRNCFAWFSQRFSPLLVYAGECDGMSR